MIAKDLDAAYGFLSPGSKVTTSLVLFKARIKPLDWRDAKAVKTECVAEKCLVSISLTFNDSRFGGDVTTVFQETWLRESGQWWLVFN